MRTAALLQVPAFPVATFAQMVDIKWTHRTFSHETTIRLKKFLEVYGKQKIGDSVPRQFKGSAVTNFNIHHHVGKEVSYPENRKGVASAEGSFVAPLDQDYCWMWSNRSLQPIDIGVDLKQAKSGN